MGDTYAFRREDNGKLVNVDFCTMMSRDALGYITLPDGVEAKYVNHGKDLRRRAVPKRERHALKGPVYSDACGFSRQALAEKQKDRDLHGFRDIEFVPDEREPGFMRVKASSRSAMNRYIKHLGYINRSGAKSGCPISPETLRKAETFVQQHHQMPPETCLRSS